MFTISIFFSQKGTKKNHVNGVERNYLRIYANKPGVWLTYSWDLPKSLSSDVLYLVYRKKDISKEERIAQMGFSIVDEWAIGKLDTSVAKYMQKARG